MLKRFSHIGIAVNNLEEAVADYSRMFGIQPEPAKQHSAVPGLKTRLLFAGGNYIEVLQPTVGADHPDGAAARFLQKRGEGVYYIAFVVDNAAGALDSIAANGASVVRGSASIPSASRRGFVHPRFTRGVLIELVEEGVIPPPPGKPTGVLSHFDHIGIAVRSMDETLAAYKKLFGLDPLPKGDSQVSGVNTAKLPVGKGFFIEIIEPTSGPYGGVARLLEKRGEGVSQLTFLVDDLAGVMKSLATKGVQIVDSRQMAGPKVGLRLGFVHPKSCHGVMIELVQKPL